MELAYYILPGTYQKNDYYLKMHNQLYSFWHTNWSKVFSGLCHPTEVKNSEFRRQSYISALINDSHEVIGMTLHTVFNLESIADCHHHYFTNNYSDQFIIELKKRQLTKVISIEYLTVAENCRKGELGFSVAKYLVSLAHRLQLLLRAEASISSCRKDVKIDKLEMQFGGKPLNPAGSIHGIETQNLITYSSDLIEPPTLTSSIDTIWTKRFFIEPSDVVQRIEPTLHDAYL